MHNERAVAGFRRRRRQGVGVDDFNATPPHDHRRAVDDSSKSDDPSAEHLIHDTLVAAATKLMLATAARPADRFELVKHARTELDVLAVWLDGGRGELASCHPA